MLHRVWTLLRDTVEGFVNDGAMSRGAAIAYYTIFSIAPLLVIATAIAGLAFGREAVEGAIAELKAKNVKLQSDTWRTGHGGSKIIFLDPSATGNVVIELAELAAGH